MFNFLLRLIIVCISVSNVYSQTVIYQDDMELPSTWRGNRVPGTYSSYVGGNSSLNDLPTNDPQYSSLDTSYRLLGTGIGSSTPELDTLLFPNITGLDRTKRYTIRFKLSSIAYNPSSNLAAGIDISDTIKLDWSASNGIGWLTEVVIIGNNNATWGFTSAGITVSKLSTLSPTTYTSSTITPIKEVSLTLPLNVAQLRIRIPIRINAIGESVLIDDVQVLAPAPLPITLDYFTATPKNTSIELNWGTLSETNNDYFSIYKSPNGLEYWELIGNVQGMGNSSVPTDYSFIDNTPNNGLNYYVLMQTDYDGKREQFPPIVVMFIVSPVQSVWDKYNILGQEIR